MTMIKKTYIVPESIIVELAFRRNLMLSASDENGQIIGDGGEGDGTDMGAKQNDYDMEEIEFDMWK